SKDGGLTWQVVQPTLAGQVDTHPETLDPYTYVEEDSGRVFDIDLYGENLAVGLPVGAFLSWSDDEGATWLTSTVSIPGLNDHQTLFAGPTPIGNPLLKSVDPRFPEVLYYCVNQVADSWCARSINGGLTFTMGATPAYLGADPETNDVVCGGLHGHLATDSAGRLFLPKGHCGDPWLAISEDGGDSWTRIQISNKIRAADTQMAVAVDSADNLYYVWFDDIHHLPYLSISRDHGKTWSAPRMLGPPGVYEVNFPTIAAGDPGKIALTFPGTTVNDQSDPSRPWNSYVVISTDALSSDPTFVSNISNPANDPVYRGACLGRCGRMFDFLDVVISPNDGSVWATAVDTCTAKTGCPTNPKAASDDMRGIAIRQISGPPLIGTGACPGKANKCK
ncbi:MAG TPA: sialidase family protein, partial [Pyrinomonadaceae bacterium]